MTQRQEVTKGCWKNGDNRLAQHRVAANLQFVKSTINQSAIKKKQGMPVSTYSGLTLQMCSTIG